MNNGPETQAVAIGYTPGAPAPKILGQGRGLMAEAILEKAKELGIPTKTEPALVAFLMQLDLNAWVPPELFTAVRLSKPNRTRHDYYAIAWRLPLIVWQGLFFVGPLLFMVAMSFFLVKNYRMEATFQFANWERMLTRGFFWDAYFLTLGLALLATAVTSALAFPASYFLAFKARESTRRWAVFFLIIPFFTSYLVRIFAWQVILAQQGVINAGLSLLGLGPYQMLNTTLGTMVGYLTLCLPLAVILQTFALANIDKRLVEAAHNLGCGGLRTVFAVVMPLAKTGLVVAAVFCFILSFGDFVSPYYLGGSKPPTLSILIVDTSKSGQQWPRAAVVAIMMIVTLLVAALGAIGFAYRKRGT